MAGNCGSCTLCCTVMKVEMVPAKPERCACPFEKDKACSIYHQRPDPCRGFECVWLCSQRWPDKALPSSERPDRTRVVLEVNSKGNVIAHCETPEAWQGDRIRKRLLIFARSTIVTLDHGDGRVSLLKADGTTEDLEFLDVAPNGERRYIRRKR